jgi:DNA-binding NarL/FixJ family response regulator
MSTVFTILVVDDVPANIGVLLDALASDYRLLVAENAEGCLQQLPHARPDLILLDVRLPGMSGFDLCQQLKKSPQWAGIPIIFMTALDEPGEKARALGLGAVDYVTKPLHVPEVLARVRTHLRLLALQRELQSRNEVLETEISLRRDMEDQLRQSLDQGIAAAARDGRILFSTRLADNLLQIYFGAHPRLRLPEALLSQVMATFSSPASDLFQFSHPSVPSRSLSVRLFASPNGSPLLLHLLDSGAKGPAALIPLGLSSREAEVLYWIAEGKTHPEIATILGAALRTVHKHAENIYRKLNLENRSAAMRLALETLN